MRNSCHLPGMPALHTTHHLQAALRNQIPDLAETLSVPLAAPTHGSAPYRTTVIGPRCETARLYTPLPFPHTKQQICDFSRVVTSQKFTIRTTSSNTGTRSAGKVFATRASRYKKQ
ncbi:hypothetical protein RRG08_061985 [Elysia crispata]|uniref:Uncharacterized protein n=1 Tax=Elysia crispata TaxID=231223 RepID=A0AAE1A334_9GAST|nr:hypothetical protein RRG08_061985 [Elysia crispata]